MGTGASINVDQMDHETFKTQAGEYYTEEIFNEFKNEQGFVSKTKWLELQDLIRDSPKIKEIFHSKLKPDCATVTVPEMEDLVKKLGFIPSEEDLLDPDSSRRVGFLEFVNIILSKLATKDLQKEIIETFKVFDLDGDGFISASELKEVLNNLGDNLSEKEALDMINDADADGDGRLNLTEYSKKMSHVEL